MGMLLLLAFSLHAFAAEKKLTVLSEVGVLQAFQADFPEIEAGMIDFTQPETFLATWTWNITSNGPFAIDVEPGTTGYEWLDSWLVVDLYSREWIHHPGEATHFFRVHLNRPKMFDPQRRELAFLSGNVLPEGPNSIYFMLSWDTSEDRPAFDPLVNREWVNVEATSDAKSIQVPFLVTVYGWSF